ncbi:MAG: hypothetical protein AB9880_09265 [Christensenellales bacterium]
MRDLASLARVAAELALRGISRREAAGRLHLSCSALNKKLRGEAKLSDEELLLLKRLSAGAREEGQA